MSSSEVFSRPSRPDLSRRVLLSLLLFSGLSLGAALLYGAAWLPGSPIAQSAAIVGTLLLLTPGLFFILKRGGYSRSPPTWFVVHVICSILGASLIFVHVAATNWFSPPGLVLLALVFLLVQGIVSRVFVSRTLSHLFAGTPASFNFSEPLQVNQERLRQVIDTKIVLLQTIDASADEGLFSPTLRHWLSKPSHTFRYQLLIEEEYRLVGARKRAGVVLQWWRRLHLFVALLFFVGLAAHVIIMLFFAGYAAGEGQAYWWYISAWGR